MLKENWRTIARIERVADLFIVVACFFLAYYGRNSLLFWNELLNLELPLETKLAPIKDYFIVLAVALFAYAVSLNAAGAYHSMRLHSSFELFRLALFCSLLVFFVLASSSFLLKLDLSRSFIGLFCFLVGISIAAERALILEFLRYWRKRGRNYRTVIIAGTGEQALQLTKAILSRPELGVRIRAFADLQPEGDSDLIRFKSELLKLGRNPVGRILRGVSELSHALKGYAVDEVLFTDVIRVMPQVEEMIHVCTEQGVRTTLAADLFSVGLARSKMSSFGGMPLIHFETPPGDRWELSMKRVVDVVLSGTLLIILSPLFLLIALFIKLTSPGPVLFVQRRVGRNGRHFDLYKFRSMVEGAEHQLAPLLEKNEMSGPAFKLSEDPRVTGVGRFLRRFSLDELPQLWNVLIGDMSLVGPRPPVPGEVSIYERKFRRRLSMRPGLTCTWQVSGRNEISDFESWVRMDLEYIDNWSLGRDFSLLVRTIPAVILGSGAR